MARADPVGRRAAAGGAVAGALGWAVGYLFVYLTQSGSVEERLRSFNAVLDLFGGDPIPTWQAVGWLFYNAHGVDTVVPVFGGTTDQNFLATEGPVALLYILPPLVLVVAGAGTAYLAADTDPDADTDTTGPDALAGALLVLGYLPLSALGVVVFEHTVSIGAIAPDVVTGVLLAGVVYPLIFGAIGGALGGRL